MKGNAVGMSDKFGRSQGPQNGFFLKHPIPGKGYCEWVGSGPKKIKPPRMSRHERRAIAARKAKP
jgi:hypothetical protein